MSNFTVWVGIRIPQVLVAHSREELIAAIGRTPLPLEDWTIKQVLTVGKFPYQDLTATTASMLAPR